MILTLPILAFPKDLHDLLMPIITHHLSEWMQEGVNTGLCDFYLHSRDPAFRKQGVKEKMSEACISTGKRVYEFVYQTPSTVTYHFFFLASSEDELRDRLSVVHVMTL